MLFKHSLKITIAFWLCLASSVTNTTQATPAPNLKTNQPPLVILSIDGFSAEYLTKYQPENLLKIAKQGVQAKELIPVYPTKTFPNHISMITGRYPSNHGIIHNNFYSPEKRTAYRLGWVKLTKQWLTGPTIWGLANEKNLKTAAFYWPASESPELSYAATIHKKYKHTTPNKSRFDQVLNWLKLPAQERPDLISFYVATVDDAGHTFGPDAKQTQAAIANLDKLIGDFYEQLKALPFGVNFLIVSDHGMANIDINQSIKFEELNVPDEYIKVNGQTQVLIYAPKDQRNSIAAITQVAKSLKAQIGDRAAIYTKNNFPSHFNISEHEHVPEILIDIKAPAYFSSKRDHKGKATHGFDYKDNKQMAAIFIANGPSIATGNVVEPFENIHVFSVISKLLALDLPEGIDAKPEHMPKIFN